MNTTMRGSARAARCHSPLARSWAPVHVNHGAVPLSQRQLSVDASRGSFARNTTVPFINTSTSLTHHALENNVMMPASIGACLPIRSRVMLAMSVTSSSVRS